MRTAAKKLVFPVFLLVFVSFQIAAQTDTRTLNGVSYKIISPEEFDFYADAGQIKLGERYVIDDGVMSVSGTQLTLMNAGFMNSFILSQPTKLEVMTKVRIYIEITKVNTIITNYVEGKIDKLEGPESSAPITQKNTTRNLDGQNYTVYTPEEFDFYADSGRLKVGEKYVIDDDVMGISGTKLTLMNAGFMNSFILSQPTKLEMMTKVRVYVEITKVNSAITNYVEAKIIRLETL